MFQSGVTDLGATQVELLQLLPVLDGSCALIGHIFREVQAEFRDALQVLDFLHALIRNVGQREVQIAQVRQFVEVAQIGIFHPASPADSRRSHAPAHRELRYRPGR